MTWKYQIKFVDGRVGTCVSPTRIEDPADFFGRKFGLGRVTGVIEEGDGVVMDEITIEENREQ